MLFDASAVRLLGERIGSDSEISSFAQCEEDETDDPGESEKDAPRNQYRICRGIELDPKFVDCIVKRYIEWNGGRYDDVYVMRDGQKLMFDEVAVFEPEEAE